MKPVFYLGFVIFFSLITLFNISTNLCFAVEKVHAYCQDGESDMRCGKTETSVIEFESPSADKKYYHKKIRLRLKKSIFSLLNTNTAFCFTLYNHNSKQSFDKCYDSDDDISKFVYPNYITLGGIGEGKIDLAAWMKDKNTELPIESTWISYSFFLIFDCIKKFEAVPSYFLEMDQVDLPSVSLMSAPLCYDMWKKRIKKSRKINAIGKKNIPGNTMANVYDTDENTNYNGVIENNITSETLLRNYLDIKSGGRGIFGVPFYEQSFGHGDRIFLDFILSRHQHYKSIVEFGTFKGLTSLYLAMSVRLRSRENNFETFDIADFRQPYIVHSWLDNMKFNIANLELLPLDKGAVKAVLQTDFLFVDGGNKRIEAVLYASLLKVGSGIFIHHYQYDNENFDKPTERFLELEEMGFRPYYNDAAMLFNSCGRFWIREKNLQTFDIRIWLTNLGCVSITHCDVSKTWSEQFKFLTEKE
jgi:hypothetical protein